MTMKIKVKPRTVQDPGPWKWWVNLVSGVRRLVDAEGRAVLWPVRVAGVATTDLAAADEFTGRLIAAAPELLEALEATLDCDSCDAEGRLPTAQALIRRIREGG